MNVKFDFQLSIPHKLRVRDRNISLIDMKRHFMSQDFNLSVSALQETERVWKYDRISFDLSNENLNKGDCSVDFNEETALFTIDAVFTFKSKSKFRALVGDPNTKWVFGGIYISKNLSSFEHDISIGPELFDDLITPNNFNIVYGGDIMEFSYVKLEKTFSTKYYLLNTEII